MSNPVCDEHLSFAKALVRLSTLIEDRVIPAQDRALRILEGEDGQRGICDRVQALEHDVTTTRETMDRIVVILEGSNGSGGVVGRMSKMERMWALLAGAAIAGGTAGVGVWKVIAVVVGG